MSYGPYGHRYTLGSGSSSSYRGTGGYSSGLGTPYSALSAPTALSRSLSPGSARPYGSPSRLSPSRTQKPTPKSERSYFDTKPSSYIPGERRASGGLVTLRAPTDPLRGRSGSTGSIADSVKSESRQSDRLSTSTGSLVSESELDYKKLYEDLKETHERLKTKLIKTEDELDSTKRQLEKALQNNRNSLSDTEKRERRAMERKMSEMEEELKVLEQLKAENVRLREENGALIRVISKLSK